MRKCVNNYTNFQVEVKEEREGEASETRFSRRAKRALKTAPTNSPHPQLSNNVEKSKIRPQTPEK